MAHRALRAEELRTSLLEECANRRKSLRFRHDHGKSMAEGIRAAETAISALPLDDDPERWMARVLVDLEALARRLSRDPKDESGWLVSGMRSIVNTAADLHWEAVRQRIAAALEACFPERAADLMSALHQENRGRKEQLLVAARRALVDREPDRAEAFLAQLERKL